MSLSFWELVILPTCHFVNLLFCKLFILQTYVYLKLMFSVCKMCLKCSCSAYYNIDSQTNKIFASYRLLHRRHQELIYFICWMGWVGWKRGCFGINPTWLPGLAGGTGGGRSLLSVYLRIVYIILCLRYTLKLRRNSVSQFESVYFDLETSNWEMTRKRERNNSQMTYLTWATTLTLKTIWVSPPFLFVFSIFFSRRISQ